MKIVIIPGIHSPNLTDNFLNSLTQQQVSLDDVLVLPYSNYLVLSPYHLLHFLEQQQVKLSEYLLLISFSAGVVGAMGAALIWRQWGGIIPGLIALDGWGVALFGDFPIYRLSHDEFTHWSSSLLGAGVESFYAEPPVDHLQLWQSPDTVTGWQLGKIGRSRTTAAGFLANIIAGV